jgi:hypothetical protein
MTQSRTRIAFDSNTVTWFVQANCENYHPVLDTDDALRPQRVVFGCFSTATLNTIEPTVNVELQRIATAERQTTRETADGRPARTPFASVTYQRFAVFTG